MDIHTLIAVAEKTAGAPLSGLSAKSVQARMFCAWMVRASAADAARFKPAAGVSESAFQRLVAAYEQRLALGKDYCRDWAARHARLMAAATAAGLTD